MKRIIAVLCVLTSLNLNAQNNVFPTSGNVGIGNTSPAEKLVVNGNIQIDGTNGVLGMGSRVVLQAPSMSAQNNYVRGVLANNIRWNSVTNKWKVDNGLNNDFAMIQFNDHGGIAFLSRPETGASYEITNEDLLANYQRMFIDNQGNVGIGTNDTKSYKLAVNGNAIFTNIKVKLYSTWPDYVFKRDYQLMPLTDLEKYIQQHNHLPGVASASEVEKDGLDVGSNQSTLLKKIEELTLYIIEQNKQLQALKEQVAEQGRQIKARK